LPTRKKVEAKLLPGTSGLSVLYENHRFSLDHKLSSKMRFWDTLNVQQTDGTASSVTLSNCVSVRNWTQESKRERFYFVGVLELITQNKRVTFSKYKAMM
jgi:hypothetical protein